MKKRSKGLKLSERVQLVRRTLANKLWSCIYEKCNGSICRSR